MKNKNIEKKLKSEQGSITTIVTVTVLFFLTVLATAYMITGAMRKAQLKSELVMKDAYSGDLDNLEQIYRNAMKVKLSKLKQTGEKVTTTTVVVDESGLELTMPGGYKIPQESPVYISKGVIMENAATGDQWIWIEVPKTVFITATSDTDYTKIEADLKTYTATYKSDTYKDIYYSDQTTGLTSNQYTELYQKMLNSVYTKGGFWIGRYEAGDSVSAARASESAGIANPAVSRANVIPYNYVTCAQAQNLASQIAPVGFTSSLMFGVQWDLVCRFIETNGTNPGTSAATIQAAIKSDSTDWGNYYNSQFTINRGKYAKYGALSTWYYYNEDLTSRVIGGVKQSITSNNNTVLLTTGASDKNCILNIYDFAGNVREWTLESYTSDAGTPCSYRGGSCYGTGSDRPAAYRGNVTTTHSYSSAGFRTTLL